MPEFGHARPSQRDRLDPNLWLVGVQGALVGAICFSGLVAFLHLGFWVATGTMAGAVVASLLVRRLDAEACLDPAARQRLNLRVLVAGLGVGVVAAGAWLAMLLGAPWSLAAGGLLFLLTGVRAYRIEADRQHVLEVPNA